MRPFMIVAAATLVLVGASGCSNMKPWEQRALSGGAIGAAAGAGVGSMLGAPAVGAAVGGAAGAAIGGLTAGPEKEKPRKE